jgi:NAD(P)-dependent dehydrogenase (short-subunit alcohol dehydrogenase family)
VSRALVTGGASGIGAATVARLRQVGMHVFLTAKAAVSHLRDAGGGALVVVASQLGLVAATSAAAYCASKGAAVMLTRAMARDHAADSRDRGCDRLSRVAPRELDDRHGSRRRWGLLDSLA